MKIDITEEEKMSNKEMIIFIYEKILKYNWSAEVQYENSSSISIKLLSPNLKTNTRVVLQKE